MSKSKITSDTLKKKILAKQLRKESSLVREESMSFLDEFERLIYKD